MSAAMFGVGNYQKDISGDDDEEDEVETEEPRKPSYWGEQINANPKKLREDLIFDPLLACVWSYLAYYNIGNLLRSQVEWCSLHVTILLLMVSSYGFLISIRIIWIARLARTYVMQRLIPEYLPRVWPAFFPPLPILKEGTKAGERTVGMNGHVDRIVEMS